MEHNITGPILVSVAFSLAACLFFWRSHVSIGWLKSNEPFASSFEMIIMSILVVLTMGSLGYLASDRLLFNYDHYRISKNEALERKATIEDKGYELWSIIDSRPIEKFRIESCSESPLVTDDEYREVDVNSEEIKGSYSRLYVFCQLKGKPRN